MTQESSHHEQAEAKRQPAARAIHKIEAPDDTDRGKPPTCHSDRRDGLDGTRGAGRAHPPEQAEERRGPATAFAGLDRCTALEGHARPYLAGGRRTTPS